MATSWRDESRIGTFRDHRFALPTARAVIAAFIDMTSTGMGFATSCTGTSQVSRYRTGGGCDRDSGYRPNGPTAGRYPIPPGKIQRQHSASVAPGPCPHRGDRTERAHDRLCDQTPCGRLPRPSYCRATTGPADPRTAPRRAGRCGSGLQRRCCTRVLGWSEIVALTL